MTPRLSQRTIQTGVERLPARHDAPRHQHREAYVTVVFDGRYEQAAYAGRLLIGAGDLVLQPTFDCHADRMMSPGIELLRLPWTTEFGLGGVFGDLPVDEIRRAARDSVPGAVALVRTLLATRQPRPRRIAHLCDQLAADLSVDPNLRIGLWAARHGRSREALSREFRAVYGVSADRYRGELRARSAWAAIVGGTLPLSLQAQEAGFADQSHMTRAVSWLTGSPPSAWRGRRGAAPASDRRRRP